MAGKECIIQISAGGYLESQVSFDRVRQKLEPILRAMPVKAVIMGWSARPEVYRQTKRLLDGYGTQLYLWLPVFSEAGLLKDVRGLIDDHGAPVAGHRLSEGENFEFACPNTPQNIDAFLEIYQENFSALPLDGVFLDKIRFPSFANGCSGVFSCFCPECRRRYDAVGLDVAPVLSQMAKVAAGEDGYDQIPLKMTRYQRGRYEFENPLWNSFFETKSLFISQALAPVILFFKERGLGVGLDVFSPFAAYFVGQDIAKLAQMADFIKPMMYRVTQAPAGIPYEFAQLCRETVPASAVGEATARASEVICHRHDASGVAGLSFMKEELAGLAETGCDVYCGTEINRVKDVAFTTRDYVAENLRALEETSVKGCVLSWDLLSAPDSHIRAVIEHFSEQG